MKQYFLWLAKLVSLVVIFVVVVPSLLGAVLSATQGEMGAIAATSKNTVAVIELTGEIQSAKEIIEELYKAGRDEKIQGIVLRVNSPGGGVAPSQDIYAAVKKVKALKPVVASMGSLAASGGLYSAVGASKIFCQPGTMTGSIGVIMHLPNFKKLAEKVGFEMITVKSGHFKDVGNSFRDMTDEERAFLEKTILRVQEDFVVAVAESRHIDIAKVREFADGRILLGSEALELKLVDQYGDLYDAARAVFELRGEPLAESELPTLYYPLDKFSQVRKFFDALSTLPRIFSSSVELKYLMQ